MSTLIEWVPPASAMLLIAFALLVGAWILYEVFGEEDE